MAEETYIEKFAQYYHSLGYEQIPADVIDAAKLHILDSLGCLLAGSRLGPGELTYRLAVASSDRTSRSNVTLLGTRDRASYLDAVQAMSTAAHCGEMDDIHSGAGTCVGAMIIPPMLAMAEKFGGGGHRFLEAVIAGYEIIIRVGLSIDAPKLFARGWWPSTLCGAFGVAGAGAKFLGRSVDDTVNALGIASLHSGGMLTGGNEGASARHLAFGHAAQNGILALLATEQGLSGPKRALEDPRGFCMTLCAEPRWEYLESFDKFYLPEIAFKPYPCARQLHSGVEALLKILQQTAPPPSTIEAIELFLPTQNAAMMNRPTTGASHAAVVGSGQYVMAVTALRGKIDLASFEDEYLRDDQVRQLMAKVTVSGSAELDSHFPKYWPGRVTIRVRGGPTHSEEIIVPKGERENPMTRQEVEEKFLALAGPTLGEQAARLAMQKVASLESRDSLAAMLAALV